MNNAINIFCQDVLAWCNEYSGDKFHAVFCDPPYHLTEVVKRFGKEDATPAKYGTDGAFQRASKGFMGKDWDGGDIAFRHETWDAIRQHLYPGAFLFAFAGSRGYHRMACAIEDAGFIIHPAIVWIQGQGFPKATRILPREYAETGTVSAGAASSNTKALGPFAARYPTTRPSSEMAKRFEWHRYGGQVLKPSCEFICVAQVPYEGKPLDCITQTGAGAINVKAGRIGKAKVKTQGGNKFPSLYGEYADCPESEREGRWPANVIIGSEVAPILDAQSGECITGTIKPYKQQHNPSSYSVTSGMATSKREGSSGGASRYFFNTNWNAEVEERLETTEPFFYCGKAGSSEREKGLEDFEATTVNDGRQTPVDNPYQRGETLRKNIHPCQKPLRLTKYLASLLLGPAEYAPRRILCPFAGTGSEAIGAMLAGFEEIVAIELSEEYTAIMRERVAFWSNRQGLFAQLQEEEEESPAVVQSSLEF